ncbi:hypothetical protein FRC04_011748 [Tulasnella sp. 424]|nr:hypothetical protein FRC04_011748 [Tulasnella sp. 424]KAG8978092.1 hypothetical protein FRC05_011208 [Tulasnella sp. 425]
MDNAFLNELSRPLEPTNNRRPATTPVRKRAPKNEKVTTLDDFFTPTKTKSPLTARPKPKSKLRPESPLPSTPSASRASKTGHAREDEGRNVGTSITNKSLAELPDSIGTIIPDSEEERRKLSPSSEENLVEPPATSKRGNQWKIRRRVVSSEDSDVDLDATPSRSPKKRALHHSSEEEGRANSPSKRHALVTSSTRTPTSKSTASREVIQIFDSDQERIVQKAPEISSLRRQSSLHSLGQQNGTRGVLAVQAVGPDKECECHDSLESSTELSDDEIIPETQDTVENWSDNAGEMGYVSPRNLKKTFSPITPNSPFTAFSPALTQPTVPPARSRSLKGLGIFATQSDEELIPDEVTEASPVKGSSKRHSVRSMSDDKEVIEISSDESEKEYFDLGGPLPAPRSKRAAAPKPAKPKSKAIAKTKDADVPSTPSTPVSKGKSKRTVGPATPTSPSGKAMSRVAKARFLEHYARELFDDLNEHVFKHVLDGCELVWSKLLLSTAGKAFLRKERDENGAVRHNPDGSVAVGLTIELSTKVVDCEERVRNTLSHEMCHLSTWLVDGVGQPDHGSAWKKWAAKVTRYRPDIEISTRHTYEIAYKFSWQCTNTACAHIYGRFSKSIDITKQGCGLCRSVLKPLFETNAKPKSAWQEFMKQNLKTIKSENPGISQSAAMQILSEMWKQTKSDASSTPGGSDAMDDIVAGLGRLNV